MPENGPGAEQIECLRDLVRWFEAEKVPGVVVGGMAVLFLGRERATNDIDALVYLDDKGVKRLLASALAFGFAPRLRDVLEVVKTSHMLLVVHSATSVPVDIMLGAVPYEKEIIKRGVKKTTGGVSIPLASPADLVVMKILASRPRDLVDVEGLLDRNPRMSISRIRAKVKELAVGLELPEMVETLEDILRRRRKK